MTYLEDARSYYPPILSFALAHRMLASLRKMCYAAKCCVTTLTISPLSPGTSLCEGFIAVGPRLMEGRGFASKNGGGDFDVDHY